MSNMPCKPCWSLVLALLMSHAAVAADSDHSKRVEPQMRELREFSRQLQEAIGQSTRELERAVPKLQREWQHLEGRLRQDAPKLARQWRDLLEKFRDDMRRRQVPAPKSREVMV